MKSTDLLLIIATIYVAPHVNADTAISLAIALLVAWFLHFAYNVYQVTKRNDRDNAS